MNPWLTSFFNLTAGLEKFINGVLAAFQVWVGAYGYFLSEWDPATVILIQSLIGAVQMLYTTNGTVQKPADPDRPQ